MTRERSEAGEYVETVSTDRVLEVFDEVDGPVVTSADVADALECSRETARRKLTVLAEQGRVDRRKTAGRVVWWLMDEQRARGGPVDPLFGLVGLFGDDDEAAARARERSEAWGEEFDRQMMDDVDPDEA